MTTVPRALVSPGQRKGNFSVCAWLSGSFERIILLDERLPLNLSDPFNALAASSTKPSAQPLPVSCTIDGGFTTRSLQILVPSAASATPTSGTTNIRGSFP